MTYVDLQSRGIEFPASVVAELELVGIEIDRCESAGPGGRRVRAVRLVGHAEEVAAPPPSDTEGETALPSAAASADWDEVRVYRSSLRLAIETAWAELRGGDGRALRAVDARLTRPRRRPSARLMVPLAVLVTIAAITAIVTSTSGGRTHRQLIAHDHPRSATSGRAVARRSAAEHPKATASPRAPASSPHISAAAASPRTSNSSISAASPAGSSPGVSTGAVSGPTESRVSTPSGAVQAFYAAAARHHYGAAWALADANMRSQLEGYAAFANQMSSVRSITFHRAQMLASREANAATVAVQTKSVQSTRMQECGGSVRTVRTTAGWLLDGISIACS